ncbi:MAG: hypothetical protein CVV53_06220 [Spirochaetae bacterium HGW-Spirochaetae-9]|nr:MAG: hypothetical protein CVV53_06220 [Spirochaetae bacterium HGW-Spirochaetae-9]
MRYSSIVASALLSALMMPLIIGFAERKNLYDSTGERKIHSGNIPRLGGIGMFWAFFAILSLFAFWGNRSTQGGLGVELVDLLPLAFGALGMHFLGLADDIKDLPARYKFLMQSLFALVAVGFGFRFRGLSFGDSLLTGSWTWLSWILSWGWIVGMTNAFNLIDGMDGLAGGVAAIASLAFSALYFIEGYVASAFICFTLAGVVIGFLFTNFPAPRARIFMGDSGSLFLGFMLSVMPFLGQGVRGFAESRTRLSPGLLPSIALLALPVIDTLYAILRRWWAGLSLATPDRKHIHHRLLDLGFTPRRILMIVYPLTVLQAAAFLIASRMSPINSAVLSISVVILMNIFFIIVSESHSRKNEPQR